MYYIKIAFKTITH